ncbi:TPA: hypothetical protein DIC20_00065 [Candidatus Dependentiae bacterium]|nr:MAG: Cation-transporting P-type ATPase [candidate division TM6 bacterium GW2011_GWF2_36_131]KKQ02601.1 MAG: Cation-transporting P-type ATPase [candidate division TM6 bacterium GW2011_GWE2_36_25]KKQ19050.1 MAG: Cation-transporting P-type ATPase [candidate division TM6 bacterium GW2011_GWA2_36_9]HBR70186.1 hypothetical protein [Candidatus Dependentiae bacterium]HCU00082.1 hypothetical protein [Candidatus Dependentiae bacterium]
MIEQKNSFSHFSHKESSEVIEELHTSSELGLATADIISLLKKYGKNEIPEKRITWLALLVRQTTSLFMLIFFAIVLLYIFLGAYVDAIILGLIILINIAISFYQEFSAYKEFQSMRHFLRRFTTVLRDGKEQEVLVSTLVPGDILLLYPGDIVPADARMISEENCTVDEATLTGESNPIRKTESISSKKEITVFDAKNILFTGTTILSGKAIAVVFATGKNTQFGALAQVAKNNHESSLVKGTTQLSRFLLKFIFIVLALVSIAHLIIKGPTFSSFEFIIFIAALATSAIPEALPVIVVVSLSRGASFLAKKRQVIIKRLSALEDLGAAQVICLDKTGTITENSLKVVSVYGSADTVFWQMLAASISLEKVEKAKTGFELALWQFLSEQEKETYKTYKKIKEIPFDANLRRNIVLVHQDGNYEVLVRGSCETIIKICSLSREQLVPLQKWLDEQESQGNRILAVAKQSLSHVPENLAAFNYKLQLIGLVAFADPIKNSALEAVRRAQTLNLQIKIISGDTPLVCGAVAQKIGLIKDASAVVTGDMFENASWSKKNDLVFNNAVFARILPQQKCEIIQILQEKFPVAFLGDGINDVPALKLAHVSLVVDNAVDVAREAADILLMKHSLFIVIQAIEEGRKIIANILKYIRITISANMGNFYSLAIASLFIPFVPMLPVQILLLNFLSDFPLITLATDDVDAEELRLPGKYNVKDLGMVGTVFGFVSTVFDLMCFVIFVRYSPIMLQTAWFVLSALTEIVFIFSMRVKKPFWRGPKPGILLLSLSLLVCVVTISLPYLRWADDYLHFIVLPIPLMLLIIGLVILYFVVNELVKIIYYHLMKA